MSRPPPTFTLFPYTTLFRSSSVDARSFLRRRQDRAGDRRLARDRLHDRRRVLESRPGARLHLRPQGRGLRRRRDRKSTRLNSSHTVISYAVFCLKKKKKYV